jgi:excisionase family DNA binding protein
MNKVAYTVEEARHMMNIGRTKFYEEVKAGRLRTVKLGKKTLIPAAEPAKWVTVHIPPCGAARRLSDCVTLTRLA